MSHPKLTAIAVAFLMLPLFALGATGEAAPTNGGPITIDADAVWDENGDLDAEVTVASGATLTIAEDVEIDVASGASLTIEAGATLVMEQDSQLHADVETYPMYTNAYQTGASLTIEEGTITDGFDITFHSHADSNLSNWVVKWDGFSEDMEGESHTLSFSAAPAGDLTFEFEMLGWAWNALIIAEIEVQEDFSFSDTYSPTEFAPSSFFLWEDPTWSLNIAGTAMLNEAEISGADFDITGTVAMTDSEIEACGPVTLAGAAASLTTTDGHIKHSIADHDVRADGVASLTWGADTEGSGGVVDRWERIIGTQNIHVPAHSVGISFHDLGPSEEDTNPYLSGSTGDLLVRGGGERTVEIGWSNGTVWTESAYMVIESFVTAWNAQDHMPSYGAGQTIPLSWEAHIDLTDEIHMPLVELTEVAPLSGEGTTGTSVEVRISLRNDGEAPAMVPIQCYENDEDRERADVTPSWPYIEVGAGETASTTVRWSNADAGELGLSCEVLTPTQLVDEDAFGQSTLAGSTVTWAADVDEGINMVPILVASAIGIVIALLVVMRLVQAGPGVLGEEEEGAEEDGRVDRFSKLEDAFKGEAEEVEEATED